MIKRINTVKQVICILFLGVFFCNTANGQINKHLSAIESVIGDKERNIVFGWLTAITNGENGNYYVCDFQASNIFELNEENRITRVIGAPGAGPGEILQPSDISYDSGVLAVSESGNMRVQLLDVNGMYINSFRDLNRPGNLAYSNNLVYGIVAKRTNDYTQIINVFDAEGTLLRQFGNLHFKENWYGNLGYIAIYNNKIYELNRYLPEIRIFSKEGVLLKKHNLYREVYKKLVPENYNKKNYKIVNNVMMLRHFFRAFYVDHKGMYVGYYKSFKGRKGTVIDQFNDNGELMASFETDEIDDINDFFVKEKNGKLIFYILGNNNNGEPGVHLAICK